jgi:hypothetical protein
MTWHPYPLERPEEEGWFIVTAKREVFDACWSRGKWYGEAGWIETTVTAWMPLPPPYVKEG